MSTARLCKHLRTKKMFIPALAHEAFSNDSEEMGHSSHCWCNCTMAETGPDDGAVGVERCVNTRSCFEE
jgi:hypothetical protein